MKEEIEKALDEFRSDQSITTYDEAATKQVVILRLLAALGWNPYVINEVTPEYPVEGGKVDYSLRDANSNKVFVEVKRAGEDLSGHQNQLLDYSFKHGVRLAVLTNGLTWWFYLPLKEGSWEERRFHSIDILKQEVREGTSRLVDFLSRENVLSGAAVDSAEARYNSLRRDRTIEDVLPSAWNEVISDPDGLLVDLIAETVERLCRLKPRQELIQCFLNEKIRSVPVSMDNSTSRGTASPPVQTISKTRQGSPISIQRTRVYVGKSIKSFTFAGETFSVRTWKDLLITLVGEVYRRHPTDIERVLELRGTKRLYFSRREQDLRAPVAVGNSGYFAETHFSADNMVQQCHKVLPLFGYSPRDLDIDCG